MALVRVPAPISIPPVALAVTRFHGRFSDTVLWRALTLRTLRDTSLNDKPFATRVASDFVARARFGSSFGSVRSGTALREAILVGDNMGKRDRNAGTRRSYDLSIARADRCWSRFVKAICVVHKNMQLEAISKH